MSAIPITVTGTVATEPAARTLPSGRACASFRLAVNHWRVDKDTGEFVTDGTSWFSVDCYGDLASNSSMSLHSGTAVIVTGTLKIRQWETEERSGIAPTVVAEHIGPDLRYGTANYRRSKAPERAQNQAGPAAQAQQRGRPIRRSPRAGTPCRTRPQTAGSPRPGTAQAPPSPQAAVSRLPLRSPLRMQSRPQRSVMPRSHRTPQKPPHRSDRFAATVDRRDRLK
jgi:single stranded DNA-binding protein